MVRQRARIRFRKQGDLRFLGHRDLARLLERLFRRAGLKLATSEGFHPKPRMSFPSALALGIEGLDEVMELELAEPHTAEELFAALAPRAVPGLSFHGVDILPPGARKARLQSTTYQIPIPAERRLETAQRIARLLAEASPPLCCTRGGRPLPLRPAVAELTLQEGTLRMRLAARREASPGPRDVLAGLGLEDLERAGCWLTRTQVELAP